MNELVTRYEVEWFNAKVKHDQMVNDAAATKTSLPDNYWHREHEARRRLHIAQALAEALQE